MSAGREIAFFGSSLLSSFWNGAATYYRGILRALHARGFRVTFHEPDAYDRQAHRDLDEVPWARVVVYPNDPLAALSAVESAASADVIIKASGVGVFDELLEEAVVARRGPGCAIVFWDVDAPATLDRLERDGRDPFRAILPRFDLVLTYGGGDPVLRRYAALGARRAAAIYNGLDPETHFEAPPDPRYAADLSLLANRLPDREARVDAFFFEAARAAPERRFLLGGAGWEGALLPANVRWVGHVPTGDHNAWNASARAVLNVARDSMARAGFSPATRVFEAAGAGACVITDAWEGVDHFFAPGREILVARDGAEIAALLADLDAARAREIGRAARRRALAEHTYEERAGAVVAALDAATRERP